MVHLGVRQTPPYVTLWIPKLTAECVMITSWLAVLGLDIPAQPA
jgi:hypothetical protein